MNIESILINHLRWGEIRVVFVDEDNFGKILLYPGQCEEYKKWVRSHTKEISDFIKHPVTWEEVGVKDSPL